MNQVRWATSRPVSQVRIRWLRPGGAYRPAGALAQVRPGRGALNAAWSLARALAWAPIDAVLGLRELSGLAVLAPTLWVAELCLRDSGLYGLIVNLPGLAVVWAAAHGAIRAGRDWRGLPPRGRRGA